MKREMKNARSLLIVALSLLAALTGCTSSAPTQSASQPTETKPAFQPTYLTGREALQQMYVAAHGWAPDAKPYNLQSIATKEDNGQDGKAGIWGAGFASLSRRSVKVYSWSGIKADDAPEPGISARPEDTYNPANPSTAAFDLAFLKVDSADALKTAEKHGGEKLLKASPTTNVFYSINWSARDGKLTWRVAFGESQNQPKLAVDVDASTGQFMKVEK
jgi:hypothetical protein